VASNRLSASRRSLGAFALVPIVVAPHPEVETMHRIALIAPLLCAVLTTACANPAVQAPPTAP
jgi:hypothetical protein